MSWAPRCPPGTRFAASAWEFYLRQFFSSAQLSEPMNGWEAAPTEREAAASP